MELAMTGKAFTELNRSELMVQLLFYTRIFARFSPEQKAGLPACPRLSMIGLSSSNLGLPNQDGSCGGFCKWSLHAVGH